MEQQWEQVNANIKRKKRPVLEEPKQEVVKPKLKKKVSKKDD